MKFNDETKAVKEFSEKNWLGFGVHKVHIGMIELTEKNGKECVEITVLGPNDEEDTAVVWFSTDKAANYSFNVLRQIYVHNAPEARKDAARDTMDSVKDTTELVEKLNEKLVGGECWFTKYLDPSRTYTAQDGTVRQSVNKNIYGYEPKPRPELMPAGGDTSDQITKDNVAQIFPGADTAPADAAGGIPKEW